MKKFADSAMEERDYTDYISSWSEGFLNRIADGWEAYMDKINSRSKDFDEAEDQIIEEKEAQKEMLENEVFKIKEKLELLKVERKKNEREYKRFMVAPIKVKKHYEYLKMKDEMEDKNNYLDNKKIKRLEELEKNEKMYQEEKKRKEELFEMYSDSEIEYDDYVIESKKLLSEMVKKISELDKSIYNEKINRDYDRKLAFDNLVKLKKDFSDKLKSKDSIQQLSKIIGKSLVYNLRNKPGHEYLDKESKMQIVERFANEMNSYKVDTFNFAKNVILDIDIDYSDAKEIVVEVSKIDLNKLLKNVFFNFMRRIDGVAKHATYNFYRDVYRYDDGKSDDSDEKVRDDEDYQSNSSKKESIGDRITLKNTIDNTAIDLFKMVSEKISKNENRIVEFIFDLIKKKMPNSFYANPSKSIKNDFVFALRNILREVRRELDRNVYVSERLTNIVVDSLGGVENRSYRTIITKIIAGVIKYFIVYWASEILQKDIDDYDFSDNATDRLRGFEVGKQKALNELKRLPVVTGSINKEDKFVSPADMAKELVSSTVQVENKVNFLLDKKNNKDRDEAKMNQNIQVTPLRTQYDYKGA